MAKPSLPRLVDLTGVADLELKALMKPAFAEPENRAEFPEIDACSKALFDLTADETEAAPRPVDLDPIDRLEPRDQIAAFEAAGWDVTDDSAGRCGCCASWARRSGWRSTASPVACRTSQKTTRPIRGPRRWRPTRPSSDAGSGRRQRWPTRGDKYCVP